MKSKHLLRIVGIALLVGLVLSSCIIVVTPKVSISDRLNSFASHLTDASRSSVYTDFYPNTPGYNAGASPVVWSVFTAGVYTVTIIDSSNPAAVTAIIYGGGTFATGRNATFSMLTNGSGDYMIYSVSVTSGGISFTI